MEFQKWFKSDLDHFSCQHKSKFTFFTCKVAYQGWNESLGYSGWNSVDMCNASVLYYGFTLYRAHLKLLLYSLLTPQNFIPSILPRNCLSMCCLLQTNPYKSFFHMFLLRSTCCFLSTAQPRVLLLKCFLFFFFSTPTTAGFF